MRHNSTFTECPICFKPVVAWTINQHVEECLVKISTKDTNLANWHSSIDNKDTNKIIDSSTSSKLVASGNNLKSFAQDDKMSQSPEVVAYTKTKKSSSSTTGNKLYGTVESAPRSKAKIDLCLTNNEKLAGSPETVQLRQTECHFISPPPKRAKIENTGHAHTTSFSKQNDQKLPKTSRQQAIAKTDHFVPLAEKMRPQILEEYVGQTQILGERSMLKRLLETDEIPSMVLWGPPGCGKTTLANIIANKIKRANSMRFVKLSATTAGVADVKEVIKIAKSEQSLFHRKTILFIDEIHRFNKTQQDVFLSHVENGTITMIGATTENPSFHVNSALLSRCRVFVLNKLSTKDIMTILCNAVKTLEGVVMERRSMNDMSLHNTNDTSKKVKIMVEKDALEMLANFVDGDARNALNALEMAAHSKLNSSNSSPPSNVTVNDIKESLQRSHVTYDRNGEEHYNLISALHKSVRGNDENAALYWLGRMLVGGEQPLYIARRLVRMASEDIGIADPLALNQALSAFQACHVIGQPECDVILAQATVYLARAPKSVEVYKAYGKVVQHINSYQGTLPGVPLHLRNAPTKLMRDLGYSKGYKYNPDFSGPVEQEYLPSELKGLDFFNDGE